MSSSVPSSGGKNPLDAIQFARQETSFFGRLKVRFSINGGEKKALRALGGEKFNGILPKKLQERFVKKSGFGHLGAASLSQDDKKNIEKIYKLGEKIKILKDGGIDIEELVKKFNELNGKSGVDDKFEEKVKEIEMLFKEFFSKFQQAGYNTKKLQQDFISGKIEFSEAADKCRSIKMLIDELDIIYSDKDSVTKDVLFGLLKSTDLSQNTDRILKNAGNIENINNIEKAINEIEKLKDHGKKEFLLSRIKSLDFGSDKFESELSKINEQIASLRTRETEKSKDLATEGSCTGYFGHFTAFSVDETLEPEEKAQARLENFCGEKAQTLEISIRGAYLDPDKGQSSDRKQRIEGLWLGSSIGDAYGTTMEFGKGMLEVGYQRPLSQGFFMGGVSTCDHSGKNLLPESPAGVITDDTLMSLQMAKSLKDSIPNLRPGKRLTPEQKTKFQESLFRDWKNWGSSSGSARSVLTQEFGVQTFDVGSSVENTIMISSDSVEAIEKAKTSTASSNGAMMRISSIVAYCAEKGLSEDQLEELVRAQGEITHNKEAVDAAVVLAIFNYRIINNKGQSKDQILRGVIDHFNGKNPPITGDILKVLTSYTDGPQKADNKYLEIAGQGVKLKNYDRSFNLKGEYKDCPPPSGGASDTLANAIWSFMNASSFQQGIDFAVGRGGDADTIGACAGMLLGAWYGSSDAKTVQTKSDKKTDRIPVGYNRMQTAYNFS